MPHESPADLRVLVGLRVAGQVETDDLAELTGLDDVQAMRALEQALERDEVVRVEGRTASGWQLTDEAQAEVRRRVVDDLDASGARGAVEAAADSYAVLDDRVLEVVRTWSWLDGGPRPNDHHDEQYDHKVVQSLIDVHNEVAELVAGLTEHLGRYEPYGRHLHGAVEHVVAGRADWIDGDNVRSYSRVAGWLRDDLLLTTGRWPAGIRGRS
jgi:predicted ArsR family transcriptional regulator